MSNYRKFIVALVGLVAVGLNTFLGLSVPLGMEEGLANLIIMGLSTAGVWGFANTPK